MSNIIISDENDKRNQGSEKNCILTHTSDDLGVIYTCDHEADRAAVVCEHITLARRYGLPPTYSGTSQIVSLLVDAFTRDLQDAPGYADEIRRALKEDTFTTAEGSQMSGLVEGEVIASASSRYPLQDWAQQYLGAGLSIVPVTENKRPAISSWKPYQTQIAGADEVQEWLSDPHTLGLGVVCGGVSGNLEVIDIDDADAKTRFIEALRSQDPELLKSLLLIATPKGGLHAYYRCEQIEGNQKLAMAEENGVVRVLIETRGEGGYVVAPGSDPRVHPLNKPYTISQGNVSSIPTLTPEQREGLLGLARSLNRQVRASRPDEQLDKASRKSPGQRRPGDDFNARTTWEDLLSAHGWVIDHCCGEETYWTRPGKAGGVSATTNYAGSDKLVVFSTNTPFESGTSYSKFAAYAVLSHGGDYSKAAAELARRGYGEADEGSKKKTSQASALVELAEEIELFNFKDEAYATVTVDGHEETYRLSSKGFKTWLNRQYYLAHKTTTSATAMEEALQTLTGQALFDGKTTQVGVRVTGTLDRIYLDVTVHGGETVKNLANSDGFGATKPEKSVENGTSM